MPVFVKICGLASEKDVRQAATLAPDALGFVFYPHSPRAVTPAEVAAWTAGLPTGLLKVGVFVDEPPEEVARMAMAAGLDVAQLHGNETPEHVRRSWPRTWKALRVEEGMEERARAAWAVEAFLLDSASAGLPGGTGIPADWTRAAAFVQNTPVRVVLAGGLRPDNIAAALEQVRPWGVDVGSGVESAPGRKDFEKMKDFIATCRSL